MTFDPAWADAIGKIESSGQYGILGPVTRSGDQAYGKYQVMGSNIGPWTKEVLGKELTPQQFLASPQAQDAVFATKFGQSVDKYGNPQDAASVWFTGKPLAQGANKSDVLGTTGAGYVAKFNAALGQPPNQQNIPPSVLSASNPVQQQASLPPSQSAQPQNMNPLLGMFQQQPAPYAMPQVAQQQGMAQAPPVLSPPMRRPVDLSGLAALLQNAPASVRGLAFPGIA